MKNYSTLQQRQGGAILIIALMFLVAITLFTISSMRSSNIGLFMAQNEESRIAAEQSARALLQRPSLGRRVTPPAQPVRPIALETIFLLPTRYSRVL